MATLQIIYDASTEIETIVKAVEEHIKLDRDETDVYATIQAMMQNGFDEGRRFQKQISVNSLVKDSLLSKTDI